MPTKMGRPTDNPKPYKKTFRFSSDDISKLKECVEIIKKSESEVVRQGIDLLHSELSKNK